MKAIFARLIVLGPGWMLNKNLYVFFSPHPFTLLCNRILRLCILKIIIFDPINPSPFSHTHVSTHSSKRFVYTHLWMLFLILKSTVKRNNVLHGDEIIVLVLKKDTLNENIILIMKMANIEKIWQFCSTFYVFSKGSTVQLIFFSIWFSARNVWKGGWSLVSVLKLMKILRFFSNTPVNIRFKKLWHLIWICIGHFCPCILGMFPKMTFYM